MTPQEHIHTYQAAVTGPVPQPNPLDGFYRVEREQAAGDAWDVDEVVHDVRLAVLAESQAPAERLFYVDSWTGASCPTRGNLLCAITDPDHRHRDGRSAQAPAEQEGLAEVIALIWRQHSNCNWRSTGVNVMWSCGIWHEGPIHMQPTTRDRHVAALVITQIRADATRPAPSVRPDTTADDEGSR